MRNGMVSASPMRTAILELLGRARCSGSARGAQGQSACCSPSSAASWLIFLAMLDVVAADQRLLAGTSFERGLQGDAVAGNLWASAVVRRSAANASISSLLREP